MSTYDVTPDDEPLDLRAVNDDDRLVEKLRHALSPEAAVVWDDDEDDMDPGYALLRALQLDVSADLPSESILPAGVTELLPRRRHLSRTATIAVVTAGVLSIGGVAAASAPGQPLAGVRQAVSSAVADAVDAITPDKPVGPTTVEATESASPKPTPPGDSVSDAARSAAAVLQIEDNLDRASALLDDGRYEPAKAQLAAAERKLAYVVEGVDRDRLQTRLTELQARLATATPHATPPTGKPDDKGRPQEAGKPDDKGKSGSTVDRGDQGGAATARPTALPSRSSRTAASDAKLNDAARKAIDEAAERRRGSN